MNLFEAILDANHRAVAGDASAGLRPADFAGELPIVALTCVDPRLNAFFPNALGVPAEDFIWLRNAGNIITGPLSSTMRSLALACAVKGGREIAVIGHTDCQICKTTTIQLLEKLKALGVDRQRLPDNVNEFFGTFGSERQNVIKACDYIRSSPLIGPRVPVHGLLLDVETGRLESVVDGYQTLSAQLAAAEPAAGLPPKYGDISESIGAFKMKFPETKIGDLAARVENAMAREAAGMTSKIGAPIPPAPEPAAQPANSYPAKNPVHPPSLHLKGAPLPPQHKAPLPPPIRPQANFRRG
jgi:carbonic anhydrase